MASGQRGTADLMMLVEGVKNQQCGSVGFSGDFLYGTYSEINLTDPAGCLPARPPFGNGWTIS